MKNWDWSVPLKCKCCGKSIYSDPELWAYKRMTKKRKNVKSTFIYFCSWTCMRSYEKKKELGKSG